MFQLGQEVACRITGWRGVVVSVTQYLYGTTRFGVQAKYPFGQDGRPKEAFYFDAEELVPHIPEESVAMAVNNREPRPVRD